MINECVQGGIADTLTFIANVLLLQYNCSRFAMQKGLPCIPKVVLLESKEALNDQKCDE